MRVYPAVRIEGGLFAPDLLEKLISGDLPGQRPQDFGLEPRRSLTDEIAAIFSDARELWKVFKRRRERLPQAETGTSLTRNFWVIPFLSLLGYELRYNSSPPSHRAGEDEYAPPVHIVSFRQELGKVPPSGRPRLSPHALVQEFLNRTEALWGLVTNGKVLRLLRDSTYIRRQCYVEFDLEAIFEGNLFEDFAVLYRLLHRSRLPRSGADAHQCLLEQYYQYSLEQGGRVREHLREGVEKALELLGNGFLAHPKNEELRRRISEGSFSPEEFYRQLLRLIYRFLFLLVAEDRGLLSADPLYRDHYGLARFRRLVDNRAAYTEHEDLWLGLCVLWKLLSDESPQAGRKPLASLLGLPVLNGELFAPMELDRYLLTNRHLLSALWHLIYYEETPGTPPRRVNYTALDVEELGSVYESLLDYRPHIEASGSRLVFKLVSGSERKSTGSYYTPAELVAELIRSALEPVIEERLKETKTREEKEKALLSIKVVDPACGSGHFLLAAARRLGKELARIRTGEDEPSPEAVREAVRDVIAHCIYGVDKNPLAVELCRVALWLEAHVPGKPLTFLDHRIKCGDSLVGVFDLEVLKKGIPDEAFKPVANDDKAIARALKKQNQEQRSGQKGLFSGKEPELDLENLAAQARHLEEIPDDSPETIHEKQRLYAELKQKAERYRTACNLWTAAFFQTYDPKIPAETFITTDVLRRYLETGAAHPRAVAQAEALAAKHRFFHWPLEFPEVFARGGFDVVLGNPPWGQKIIKADQRIKNSILTMFPSAKGIFDLFRPFIELGIRLSRRGGFIGLVLPDTLLLKNYETTRIFILENSKIRVINWWHQPFPDALIDVITIALQHDIALTGHVTIAHIHEKNRSIIRKIPQQDFWENDRYTFNLFITPEKRALLNHFSELPRLADFFEIHEGVHSGNIRRELFLPEWVDDTCRPVIIAGSELEAYLIRWAGNFIRLSAVPKTKTRKRYANLGKKEWHERIKILVRRTGDRIIAAVDSECRYASNNFFLIFPKIFCSLDLWGLCAFLNSFFPTWFYRTIEPRQGRVYAEVKVKHLAKLPLPKAVLDQNGCRMLNTLGFERATLTQQMMDESNREILKKIEELDKYIDEEVATLLGISNEISL